MKGKAIFLKILGLALVSVFSLVLFGCNNASSDDFLVTVRVINESGRDISNVRFTGSDGSIIPVEEISRQVMGNPGQGSCCWARQDTTYTLSWWCHYNEDWQYAERGGYCGRRGGAAYPFTFNGEEETTIILEANNTWRISR